MPATSPIRASWWFMMVAVACVIVSPTVAADVRAGVVKREIYTNVPFEFVVQIKDAGSHETPTLPTMEDIAVLGAPRVNRTSRIFNRVRSEEVTFTWSLVAQREGALKIPAFTVRADGNDYETSGFTLFAMKATGADLLFAEIVSDRAYVYLGERIDLTLQVWLRQFDDEMLANPIDMNSTWSFIQIDQSRWGPFSERLAALRDRFGFRRSAPRGRIATRTIDGVDEVFYVFEFETRIWPRQAGRIDIEPVSVLAQYPTSLKRGRRGLEIDEDRLLVATPPPATIEVRAPPADERPSIYGGAVGRFAISAQAKPTNVSVGDPVTLTLTVKDMTPGGSQLEFLAPPPLDRLDELTADFQVPSDPLAGQVTGSLKTFTQTIRARSDSVTEIPALPFAYFDPRTERYEIARSAPIPLTVAPTVNVSMADVVGGALPAGGAARTELTERSGGLMANETDPAVLLADARVAASPVLAVPVVVPPLLFMAIAVGVRRSRQVRGDTGRARRRSARRSALRHIEAARRTEGAAHDDGIASAVYGYIADRCNVPGGAMTRTEATDRLHSADIDDALAREIEALLSECEHRRYGGNSGAPGGGTTTAGDDLADRAARCIDRLERERL